MNMSAVKDRRERVGRWAYAPLVVAIAAGAIGGGAGVGSADTVTAADAAVVTMAPPPLPEAGHWRLANGTGQPIYGTWGY
ncbi:hypothetical protein R3Q06_29340 [Rhodococcus erythropolis]|uniref:hypothetical protein n=1 Tax=Rhodococcus erythropolis TaxID=1833 RepID=UPI00294A056E|nr:hypothetical protein [Rhodococcus erythropolis]MDV6277600.1 hypothetical protein [Rhodococcus erythropolis]